MRKFALLFSLLLILFVGMDSTSGAAHAQTSSVSPNQTNICTESAIGRDGDLFKSVHHMIGMLGVPFCFQFLRWRYLDAFVDVAKYQVVLAIDIEKLILPDSSHWSNSTRLARCRAFYPDGFRFLSQDGFTRYYDSPDGPFTATLGVDSCAIRAEVTNP